MTAYDAHYLVLTIGMGALLWPIDRSLATAAQRRGIAVAP